MKAKVLASALLITTLSAFGTAAHASDELLGALIGAGAGAVIGHAIDRDDGAAVGGILGAVVGLAVADDDDDRRTVVVRRPPPGPVIVHRAPPPAVVVYQAPPVRYVARPVYVPVRGVPPGWHKHHDRDWDDHHRHQGERWDRDDHRDGHDRRGRDDHRGRGW
ncbi:MAG: YMGG-like glycine zipper-containing protein [Pseudomonadota bacterium]